MKSQLVTLQLLLASCSLLATNATDHQQCNELLHQCNHHCNQLKTQCTPDMMTLKSCCDLINFPLSKAPSGVYQIMTNCSCGSPFTAAVDVYCDMDATDGGWIVIQRNIKDGVKTFNKTWKDYEEGFGDLNGDKLWYGLKALHCFTKTGQWELRIDFQFENGTWSHLHYNHFSVDNTSQDYKLNIGAFTGTTTDPFAYHSGMGFSTADHGDKKSCASVASVQSGWWYNNCYRLNLNRQPPSMRLSSVWYELLKVEMKIRQHNCISQ